MSDLPSRISTLAGSEARFPFPESEELITMLNHLGLHGAHQAKRFSSRICLSSFCFHALDPQPLFRNEPLSTQNEGLYLGAPRLARESFIKQGLTSRDQRAPGFSGARSVSLLLFVAVFLFHVRTRPIVLAIVLVAALLALPRLAALAVLPGLTLPALLAALLAALLLVLGFPRLVLLL